MKSITLDQAKHIVNNGLKSISTWEYVTGREWSTLRGGDRMTPEMHQAFADAKYWDREAKILFNPIDELKVGDGITLSGYSDRSAYTIIKRTSNTITLQRDIATLLNKEDLKFEVGGFSAHCSNQDCQEYSYKADPDGGTVKIRRRNNGEWKTAGQTSGAMRASVGRHEFYDYNF